MFTDAVVDLSHWNTIPDMPTIKADGVIGIFHKATNGVGVVDVNYVARQTAAQEAGLLWAAFHFGTGAASGTDQATFFLNIVKPDTRMLVALDWESNRPYGPSMTLAQAESFVQAIYNRLNRWPVLYSGEWWLSTWLSSDYKGVLLNCPLWIASYTDTPVMPPQWSSWLFWQHSNGTVGLEPRGYEHLKGCDMDRWNGDIDSLKAFWLGTSPIQNPILALSV